MLSRPIAVIDIGTNSFHMIIAKKQKDQIEILDRERIVVRLGEGGGDYDYIKKEAEERAIQTLKHFKVIAQKHNAIIQAIATSAVREANNQQEFLRKVYQHTGIRIKVIPGQEEARLIYLGVLQAIPIFDKRALVIDIGGGSTEIILGYQAKPLFIRSLKLGAVRITERFFPKGIITEKNLKDAKNYIQNFIYDVYQEFINERLNFEIVVGSSGTLRTIKEILYEDSNSEIYFHQVKDLTEKLLKSDTSEKRQKKFKLDEKRADILPAGALILLTILENFKITKLSYSPFGLREGVIYEILFRKSKKTELREIRRNSCIKLLRKFQQEIPEATSKVSLEIVKQLGKYYPELLSHKEYLEYASLLHNIGISIAHNAHHKHSYYIITNTEHLLGFTTKELQFIATIARYHRKANPDRKHLEMKLLTPFEQNLVEFYAGILRISIGLTRIPCETKIEIQMENQVCRFLVQSDDLEVCRLLCDMASMRKELLEIKLNRKIEFQPIELVVSYPSKITIPMLY
ncbi:MAG: Ppx/GppA family phosphatase [Leptospiraceae bacterium]|nr:Ppx/GppA family phosphatase [Leptospiraceae bacterium]MDW7976624.1 Ppx/GppA phosphatase family protein [Leptospiraceae bacterium]